MLHPKNAIRNGVEIILRCPCDWERGYHDRMKRTVHPDYWQKTILDWSPGIFKQGGPGTFKNLIKIQKAFCRIRLYNFWFRLLSNNPNKYAWERSLETQQTLYIRGPAHSGRDLLISQIKMLAAAKNISTTSIPNDEWSTFKSKISQCNWNGKEADEAKFEAAENYRDVKLLTLKNVRGENSKFPFRASTLVDDLLIKRSMKQGSMVLAGYDFINQIGDSMGEN